MIGLMLVFDLHRAWRICWFLTGNLENGVIFDIIDHVGKCSRRYPESFVKFKYLLSQSKSSMNDEMMKVPSLQPQNLK